MSPKGLSRLYDTMGTKGASRLYRTIGLGRGLPPPFVFSFSFFVPMSGKSKYYVVWKGVERGVYDNWADCLRRTQGFEGAQYKSFATREEAERAFSESPYEHLSRTPRRAGPTVSKAVGPCIPQSLAVDAACSGNPGDMEYRGVHVASGRQLFHIGPMAQGTNNIGEFLAIVHALALCAKTGQTQLPIYSDSRNAIAWVKQRHCRTKLAPTAANVPIFDLIRRAEAWLHAHTYTNPILKWETEAWGENPADFGRK